MDNHTLKVLDFPKVRATLAEFTQTEFGREAAFKILPSSDIIWVKNELNCIDELMKLKEELNLRLVSDIQPLLNATDQGLLNPAMLNQIRVCLQGLRQIKEFLIKQKDRLPLVSQIAHPLQTFVPIEQTIEQAIDSSGIIKDEATPELKKIRSDLRILRNQIVNHLEKILARNPDWFQDQGLTIKGERFVLPLKLEAKGKIQGILHDYSATGKTLFVEPLELVENQNELSRLRSNETAEMKRILTKLTELVCQNRVPILQSLKIIEQLDLLQAKKSFALHFDCVKPTITDNGQLQIVNGRHPLLALKKTEIVPLNFSFPDNTRIILISGPNAGGKTVVLKTVGLFGLMLACGMYLPGRYVAMPLYQNIFADIGDEQSLESDLSSFSAHLLRIKKILQEANSKSLVLLDEIGSSTAPEEGAALAIAILESLRDHGCATLATSHLGQLKLFVQDTKGMANAAMEFKGKPTYRLIIGIPGESSALAISQELGLPTALINRAKNYLSKDWLDLSEKIKTLNEQLAKTETLNLTLIQTKTELEKLKQDYELKLTQFHTFQTEEKKKTLKEMKNLLKTTRSEIENLVRQIKEKNAEKSTIVQAKQYLSAKLSAISEPKSTITVKSPQVFKPGDYVFSNTFRKQGIVIDAKDSITVAFGNIKIKLPNEDLTKIGATQTKPSIDFDEFEFNSKLVIRGMNTYEATEALTKFIDDAVITGVKNLTIVHGKGKAVLKKLVWQKLRKDPRVETLKLAEPFEGGDGVTIVQLK